ncbi:MAG TPA: hypothetical protein VFC19_41115, partial [Candidatus Limnocylindrales bacterium]|nr:hypothetical protein [Candidatus Limnocylindrales bacterium]
RSMSTVTPAAGSPSQLDPALRRQRRELADRRRRLVTMLLHALGDTADAVEASLTRHWQIAGGDIPFGLIEEYLATRLRHRDPHALIYVDAFAWTCCIGGTWVATPAAVRGYLRRAYAHEQMLRSMVARPRRGIRVLPAVVRLGAVGATK